MVICTIHSKARFVKYGIYKKNYCVPELFPKLEIVVFIS